MVPRELADPGIDQECGVPDLGHVGCAASVTHRSPAAVAVAERRAGCIRDRRERVIRGRGPVPLPPAIASAERPFGWPTAPTSLGGTARGLSHAAAVRWWCLARSGWLLEAAEATAPARVASGPPASWVYAAAIT